MTDKAQTSWYEFLGSICKVRIIERYIYLQIENWWTWCSGQEDDGKI